MNQQAYESGKRAYQQGDWLEAVACLSEVKSHEELNGEIDHLLGNALMKLGSFESAAHAYEAALADTAYGKRGALLSNCGRAYLAAGAYQKAIDSLAQAVTDTDYPTPYKAYLALGTAYERLDDVRNAAIAYRSAAIDETNPAPVQALSNLGSCFMRLNRSADAVEAYRTALDFVTPQDSAAAIWCELALAYVATNKMPEAVDAFTHAVADETFELSAPAQAAFDAARKAMSAQQGRRPSETDALLESAGYHTALDPLDPTGASGELIPSPDDTGFFDFDESFQQQQEEPVRAKGKKRKPVALKLLFVFLFLVLIVQGLLALAYVKGYGFPTQTMVIEQVFSAKTAGSDIAPYLVSGFSASQIKELSDRIPINAEVKVLGSDQTMTDSKVHISARLATGAEQDYIVELKRDGISWKILTITTEYVSRTQSTTQQS